MLNARQKRAVARGKNWFDGFEAIEVSGERQFLRATPVSRFVSRHALRQFFTRDIERVSALRNSFRMMTQIGDDPRGVRFANLCGERFGRCLDKRLKILDAIAHLPISGPQTPTLLYIIECKTADIESQRPAVI
ncbi:MAG: hypothetical protein BroJett013_15140 [Alphaproteobacteria bacterium]|nr:MAG: hypothetical protein BroJett013_15140 [Alphaproteobacteria bacterium]